MTVSYNGQKIIPAPFVNIGKEYSRTGDGHLVGSNFVLTLTGKLLPNKGSPYGSGGFWILSGYPDDEVPNDKHGTLLTKYAALKNLFAEEGKSLEFQARDGSVPLRCYPRMRSFNVPEGIWVDYIDYNIVLEAAELFSADSSEDFYLQNGFFGSPPPNSGDRYFLQSVNESWSLEESDAQNLANPHGYRVVHNLGAVGKEVYGPEGTFGTGWEQARKWVHQRMGIAADFVYSTSGLNIPTYFNSYNYTRSESTDEYAGSYSVNESWILSSGSATEDFTVSLNKKLSDALTTVSINGKIDGLEVKSSGYIVTSIKRDTAEAKFNELYNGYPNNIFLTRAMTYSGQSGLNTIPVSYSLGRSPIGGTISYTFEYNTRPANYIPNSLYEEFNISCGNPTDVYGSIPVLGRAAGPVLQDMNTVSESTITFTCNVVMPTYSGTLSPLTTLGMTDMLASSPRSGVNAVFSSFYNSLANTYGQLFKKEDNEQWNPFNGQYQRTVSYVRQ